MNQRKMELVDSSRDKNIFQKFVVVVNTDT